MRKPDGILLEYRNPLQKPIMTWPDEPIMRNQGCRLSYLKALIGIAAIGRRR